MIAGKIKSFFANAAGVALYAAFGTVAAFFTMVFSAEAPNPPNAMSPKLAAFLSSPEKVASFTIDEINEGVFYMLVEAAKEQSKEMRSGVAMPTPPSVSGASGAVRVSMPFSANLAGFAATIGISVDLIFDGESVQTGDARIGDARLPKIAAEFIAAHMIGVYSHIKPLAKYEQVLSKTKIAAGFNEFVLTK